ncbi:hypothetical protein [Corynebacterium pacaense]|uniref:hypothetical protein n=1 Tax=Corynebacterium pacaense TaxID=1816684 RepID=UPI0009B9E335|nr:hypothetical protein [Corynebacterium pacaense]
MLLTRAVDRLLPAGATATGGISVGGLDLGSLDGTAMDAGRRVAMLLQLSKRVLNPRMSVRCHLFEAMGVSTARAQAAGTANRSTA